MTKLATYINQHGKRITVGRKTFIVEGICGDGDMAVATFAGPRSKYTAVVCPIAVVPGHPSAEVWAVVGGRRTVAKFAISANEIVELR